jgi:MtN3 and saliva related transmembrane protein
MNWYEILGITGGLLGNISLLPQIWRLFHYKTAYEISLPFLCLWLASTVCWLTYGIALASFSLIMWNSITFLLASLMLTAKLKWGMRRSSERASHSHQD